MRRTGINATAARCGSAVAVLAMLLTAGPALSANAVDIEAGLKVFKMANCMGCHKWHGQGGGGYGGKALSLRGTQLDAQNIARVVRCGIPGTGMPYHGRQSYQQDDDKGCYDRTRVEFGDHLPPLAPKLLSDRQIDSVVTYVVAQIKGRGAPTYAECEAFWGKNKRQCDEFR